jgi:hypothetical protein
MAADQGSSSSTVAAYQWYFGYPVSIRKLMVNFITYRANCSGDDRPDALRWKWVSGQFPADSTTNRIPRRLA